MQQFGVLDENLSVDESTEPYVGRNSCKQHSKVKPIRFAYKCWILASFSGVQYNIKVYESKKEDSSSEPLSTRVVLHCLSMCEVPENHHVFFDNFFALYDLLLKLAERNFRATSTVC